MWEVGGAPDVEVTGPAIDGYEDLVEIGKGAFSRVYRARQTTIDRQVAIKVLDIGLSGAERANFEREARLMGRVSTHHNIVTVIDTAFTGTGQPCIIMELYSGGSLADHIRSVEQLGPAETISSGIAIASALAVSHDAGVLHCDLKPQNILISHFGQPALGDFGISTLAEERTRTGSGIGFTLHYAAPEVIEGASPTVASDIYSLAATLYTAVAGRRPFESLTGNRQTSAELARRVLLEPPASLVAGGIPAALDKLLRAGLAKDPVERPQSAAEFAEQLYTVGTQLGYPSPPPAIPGWSQPDTERSGAVDLSPSELDQTQSSAPSRTIRPTAASAEVSATRSLERPGSAQGERPNAGAPGRDGLGPGALGDRVPSEPMAASVDRQEPGRSRRLISMGVGAAGIVGVVALVASLSGGREPPAEAVATSTPSAAFVAAADPVVAPGRPTDLVIERVDAASVEISWTGEIGDGVSYEVRRADRATPPTVTDDLSAQVWGIATGENPCLTVMALRGNRVSAPSEPACVGVVAAPSLDETRVVAGSGGDPFRIEVVSVGFSAGPATLTMFDESRNLVLGSGPTEIEIEASGRASITWPESEEPKLEPGRHLIVVERTDESASIWVEVDGKP